MKLDDVGKTIAIRRLTLPQDGGPPSDVSILLGEPKQLPDHSDFYCPYQIKGVGSEKAVYMGGIDAFQALQLARRALAADLEVLNERLARRLRWEGDEHGWLGFPDRANSE